MSAVQTSPHQGLDHCPLFGFPFFYILFVAILVFAPFLPLKLILNYLRWINIKY